jgi:uncharacterized PurR-regulated membrane protein YhhQ (DUF165 family)
MSLKTAVLFGLFVATVWFANLLIQHFGIVDVGFGLQAPAGVFMVGIAFTCATCCTAQQAPTS